MADIRLFASGMNNFVTTLTSAITNSATTIPVASVTGLPVPAAGQYLLLTLYGGSNTPEIVKVTGISGLNLTVVRAQEGTTGQAWLASSAIEARVTAGDLAQFAQGLDPLSGNARGAYAVDLQSKHTTATQVASGASAVALGADCTASASGAVAAGNGATASGTNSGALGTTASASAASSWAVGYLASASGSNSVVIGPSAISTTTETVVIGKSANISSGVGYSVAIGSTCGATSYAVAVGYNTAANGQGSVAIAGIGATSGGLDSVSVGTSTSSNGNRSVTVGRGSSSAGQEAVAIGDDAIASATGAIAIGDAASSSTAGSVAIGDGAASSTAGSVAIGTGVTTSGTYSVIIGQAIANTKDYSTVIGAYAYQAGAGTSNTLIGAYATGGSANGTTIAVGFQADASGDTATSMGAYAGAVGTACTTIGNSAYSENLRNVALGDSCWAHADYATTLGAWSEAGGASSTAVGYLAYVNSVRGIALGADSKARIENSLQIAAVPIIKNHDGGHAGSEMFHYGGTDAIIFGAEIDLKQTAADNLVSITIPTGSRFFVDEVGYVITAASGVTLQPDISFGITGNSVALLAQTTTTKNTQYAREKYTAVLTSDGQTTLTFSLKVSATGTAFTVRPYFKGIFLEV